MKTLLISLLLFNLSISIPISAQNTFKNGKSSTQYEQKLVKKDKSYSSQFIQFGMMDKNNTSFSKKYNIGVKYENCVITESLSKKAKANNRQLANSLDKKYGKTWKKDLGFLPYGL